MPPMRSPSQNASNQKVKHRLFISKKEKSNIRNIVFKIYKYNEVNDSFPKLFYSCFCEFGCEALLPTYLIPRINKNFPDHKKIALGWHGREFFYRHLVDEFWEIDQTYMQLREKSKAFLHNSKELSAMETILSKRCAVVDGKKFGNLCVTSTCLNCNNEFQVATGNISCMNCGSTNIKKSLFQGATEYKLFVKNLPKPRSRYHEILENIMPNNCVALFARNRKTYGRNFSEEHYKKIIDILNDIGYNVVLLGEPVSSLNFYHPNVVNLLNHKLAGDLEFAFAVIERCMFSVQLYTASTRISSLMEIPYILVESPDQLYGRGQEGIRLSLTTKDVKNKKLILSNYINTLENFDKFLLVFETALKNFIYDKNYHDVVFSNETNTSLQLYPKVDSVW